MGTSRWNPFTARRERREAHLLEREAFRAAKRLAREDVLVLGEDVAGLALPPDASHEVREHHRFALDGYERAQRLLDEADSLEGVDALDQVLQDARWELAAVRALEAGEPAPPRRGPCFFNPQHGPAVTALDWTPPGGTSRRVGVCRNDELRLETGADPDHREVRVGDRYVPWWQATGGGGSGATVRHTLGNSGSLVHAAIAEARVRSGLSGLDVTLRG